MDDEVKITLRLPGELHARLVAEAKGARRSLNSEIVHMLETALTDRTADGVSP